MGLKNDVFPNGSLFKKFLWRRLKHLNDEIKKKFQLISLWSKLIVVSRTIYCTAQIFAQVSKTRRIPDRSDKDEETS